MSEVYGETNSTDVALTCIVVLLALSAALNGASALAAESDGVWVLKFQDDFQRDDLGDQWITNGAEIIDGRMLLGADGSAVAKIVRAFPGDVKIEFTARPYEKKPPCDLSVTLAAERLQVRSWNYLLAFGGVNNTVNKLTGGRRLKGMRDENPDRLIEQGRTYRIVACKEGKRIWMTVDGKLLLEGIDEDIMGGPGFDAVGLVTWNGMYVDNVRVYERKAPHPDTPVYVSSLAGLIISTDDSGKLVGPTDLAKPATSAVEAYNRGDLAAARRLFRSLDGEIRAAGLAYVYGNLNHDEGPGDFPEVAGLFEQLLNADPTNRRIADYAWAASLFGEIRLFPRAEKQCSLLTALGPENNPFYDKARLYQARFLRAHGQEGGSGQVLAAAQAIFNELHAKAPDNVVLKELTGQAVPWGPQFSDQHPQAPRWAALLNEMYSRQLAIMNWWFTRRQLADGQLGGGWGDDVEILRSWGPFAMISDADPAIRDGIERLCEGVWDNVLVEGFDPHIGDVEHSAEPSADTLPTMVAIRYGDPLWFERNLASCRRIRDYYTGIDDNGFVRFKSGHFGGDGASGHLQHGADNYYCSRPMKHPFWAAWYGDRDAKQFYLNWVRGWVESTMTAKYSKATGVPPAGIWYPSGDIAPPNGAPWNDKNYNIYGCCWIGNFWIQDTFLAGYYLSRDEYFLQPLRAWMNYYEMQPPDGDTPKIDDDPVGWAIVNSRDTWNSDRTLAEYHWMTGDGSYDELFDHNRVTHRLHMPGEFEDLVNRLDRAVRQLRVNFNLYTREMLQTDRASLPGSKTAFSAFTGGLRNWEDAGVPTMEVTWEVPHTDFAAIVPYAAEDHLRVWIYNFRDEPTRVGMRIWRLTPGEYEVRTGLIAGGQGYLRKYNWHKTNSFKLRHRADVCWIDAPPGRECAVDLRLVRPLDIQAVAADPAIADRDVKATLDNKGRLVVSATVHNLGNKAVGKLDVSLVRGDSKTVARKTVKLNACRDMRTASIEVKFPPVAAGGSLEVVLDPDNRITEIYELNNTAAAGGPRK